MADLADRIVHWMQQHVAAARAEGLVVGLSGGVDSATVARLCQMTMPDAVVGVVLPCHSDPEDAAHARLVASHFELPTITVELDDAYDALRHALDTAVTRLPGYAPSGDAHPHLPQANLKPRLRMTSLYFVANTLGYLVAGTGNRSELAIGYYTKYGDGGVDFLPIGHLLKDEVCALARELRVPAPIIDKAPSAGLWLGQTDEAEMGFGYDALESYLRDGPEAVSPALALRIERLTRSSEHKRSLPPTPPATSS